jgi:hypothetical protein
MILPEDRRVAERDRHVQHGHRLLFVRPAHPAPTAPPSEYLRNGSIPELARQTLARRTERVSVRTIRIDRAAGDPSHRPPPGQSRRPAAQTSFRHPQVETCHMPILAASEPRRSRQHETAGHRPGPYYRHPHGPWRDRCAPGRVDPTRRARRRETSRTQSCLKHLRPGSARPLPLRTRQPSAITSITYVPVGDTA